MPHCQNNFKIKYKKGVKIDTTNTQTHDHSLSWLAAGIIKNGEIK
jgi:hypothetical protein